MIREHFGSRRGLARLVLEEVQWLTRSDRTSTIELDRVSRLVFVCRGNICRSAFAAEVARTLDFDAVSYGLETHIGKPADAGMIDAARSFGQDLSGHRTSPFDAYIALPSDLVAVFELSQLLRVRLLVPRTMSVPLGRWAKPARTYMHDPFSSTPEFYRKSCETIEAATRRLIADIHRAKNRTVQPDNAATRVP